jgi:hypothetical protein
MVESKKRPSGHKHGRPCGRGTQKEQKQQRGEFLSHLASLSMSRESSPVSPRGVDGARPSEPSPASTKYSFTTVPTADTTSAAAATATGEERSSRTAWEARRAARSTASAAAPVVAAAAVRAFAERKSTSEAEGGRRGSDSKAMASAMEPMRASVSRAGAGRTVLQPLPSASKVASRVLAPDGAPSEPPTAGSTTRLPPTRQVAQGCAASQVRATCHSAHSTSVRSSRDGCTAARATSTSPGVEDAVEGTSKRMVAARDPSMSATNCMPGLLRTRPTTSSSVRAVQWAAEAKACSCSSAGMSVERAPRTEKGRKSKWRA